MSKIVLYLMNLRGLKVLSSLIENNFHEQIDFVVSEIDKSMQNDYYSEIKHLCNKNKISFFKRSSQLQNYEGFAMAIGWRWIIDKYEKLIVFHDSILPKYRGFNPLVTALINGDKKIGVTAIFADKEFDRGGIIGQKIKSISFPMKIQKAIEMVSALYVELTIQIFKMLKDELKINLIPQIERDSSYSLWRDEEDYRIKWENNAEHIKRFIDAIGFPYKGASTIFSEELIRIIEAVVEEDIEISNRDPGKVICIRDGFPTVVCRKGLLTIKEAIYDKNHKSFLPQKKLRIRFK